ncbi:MAG: hypothetical protein ABIJ12_01415, partial [bacterium]
MKRNVLFILTVLMVFSFGLVNAQDITVSTNSAVWESGTKVAPGNPVTWTISLATAPYGGIVGSTNGFRVFLSSTNDATGLLPAGTFTAMTYATIGDFGNYGATYTAAPFGVNGVGADTIGFGGLSFGAPVEIDGPAWTITTQVDSLPATYLCLDSTFYPPGGAWLWSGNDGTTLNPDWGGPYCYLIEAQENIPATIDCPTEPLVFGDHCATATHQFTGTDPDPIQCGGNVVSFSMVDAGGSGSSITSAGMWSMPANMAAHLHGTYTITVTSADLCGAGTECTFEVSFGNNAPEITCGGLITVGKGNPIARTVTATDDDACDVLTFSLGGDNVDGTPSINPTTGELTYTTADPADVGSRYITVIVSDGAEVDSCNVELNVLATEPWEVQIQKTHG